MYFGSIELNFADSLLVLLIGMAITFLALAILVIAVIAYENLFKLFDKKGNKKKSAPEAAVADAVEADTDTSAADTEIVAAITAAISMMYAAESEDGEVPPFRVKSIILN